MPKSTFIALCIVFGIFCVGTSIAIALQHHKEIQADIHLLQGYKQEYRGYAKACLRHQNTACCLSSVGHMESDNALLIGDNGCKKGERESSLPCAGSYTWCSTDKGL